MDENDIWTKLHDKYIERSKIEKAYKNSYSC